MADRITKEQRSVNMSHIHGKDTSEEVLVRKYLFSMGYRFRKNVNVLPGKPDLVLPKYKTAIFINGCFWHRHKNCKYASIPKTNIEFWNRKFERNVANDKKVVRKLRSMGYHVVTIWECKLKKDFDKEMSRVIRLLHKYGGIENAS